MIITEGLTKIFKIGKKQKQEIIAVEELTLEVKEGEVFGFLGPNGAGKTTTVRMLTSLISPTRGKAFVNGLELGKDNTAIRRSVGILTESPGMYERLSAEKNLIIYAKLYDVEDPMAQVNKFLKMLGLFDRRKDPVGSFSKGMRQKLAIARALLHDPKVLFLDEPTSGLDPESAKMVRDFIEVLKERGRTIFMCTHNLDEADRLCDRIGIFKQHLITVNTPAALREQLYGRKVVIHLRELDPKWTEMVRTFPDVKSVEEKDRKLLVTLDEPERDNPEIIRRLVSAGADILFVGELRHSLEQIYLETLHIDEGV
ncbi:MAG: ABC transporter ATP-binding protein, partial [Anaerolineaceae bacterium]|nr:ABC transporter ATP-binding protein [Anaerolineaceae bacterium]